MSEQNSNVPQGTNPKLITIALINQKGGVAKTTSAINIAAALAEKGYRTCMWDLDPQANLTGSFKKSEEKDLFEFFFQGTDPDPVQIKDNLWLMKGSIDMSKFDRYALEATFPQLVIKKRFEEYEFTEMFDFLVLDCPPALGMITVNALVITDYAFVPVNAQKYSLDGLVQITNTIAEVVTNKINPNLKLGGLFFTMFDKALKLSVGLRTKIEKTFGDKVFKTVTRRNVALQEAPSRYQDIFSYDENSNGAKDYRKITEEILERVGPKLPTGKVTTEVAVGIGKPVMN